MIIMCKFKLIKGHIENMWSKFTACKMYKQVKEEQVVLKPTLRKL